MKVNVSILLSICVLIFLTTAGTSFAVNYPDTIHVPVTFYDFHSDRSNPEFEQRHFGQLRTGMVANTLGSDSKPVPGSSPYMNYYMKYWFKPWTGTAKGDFTIPKYDPKAGIEEGYYEYDTALKVDGWQKEYQQVVEYKGVDTLDTDTSFKNVVVYDSLPFVHIGNGVYKYDNQEFFPLDNIGFGNEWNHELNNKTQPKNVKHNYSFTMEMHYQFVKVPGMSFDFCGDDDVWVFLNKQLQIDLGGIHEQQQKSFNADNISGLVNGEAYDLDLFYAERHSAESHIRITTNMIFSPSNLRIYRYPGTPGVGENLPLGKSDSITVGEAVTYYGHVFDSLGVWQPKYDSLITWQVDNTENASISSNKGDNVTVTLLGNSSVTLTGHFKNPDNSSIPESEIKIILYPKSSNIDTPAVANTLKIYRYPGTPNVGANKALGNTDTIAANQPVTYYGHLFDNAGAWIPEYDSLISWKISSTSNATISGAIGESTAVTALKAGSTFTLTAGFANPDNPMQPVVEVSITIYTKNAPAASAYKLKLYGQAGTPDEGGNMPIGSMVTVIAGEPLAVYGHLFDSSGKWMSELDKFTKWSFEDGKEIGSLSALSGEKTTVTVTKTGETVVLKAQFNDPNDLSRPASEARLTISVVPGDAVRIEIIEDSLPVNITGDDMFRELILERGNSSKTVYAILRDKYGNYLSSANSVSWHSDNAAAAQLSTASGRRTTVSKSESSDGEETFIFARQEGLTPDTLKISSVGTTTIAATPNPFVPGVSVIPDIYLRNYSNIYSKGDKGILVGIETLKPLVPSGSSKDSSYGKVVVYDAVGNIVRSDLKLVMGATSRIYGVYWDGTNNNGRYTFGTYYWTIRAKMTDGKPFTANMKVGCKSK